MSDKEILQYNREQMELRKGTDRNLFLAMQEALEGDSRNLENHVYLKKKVVYAYTGDEEDAKRTRQVVDEFAFLDGRLQDLLERMKFKYADENNIYNSPLLVGGKPLGARESTAVFEKTEIEMMLMSFVMSFPYGFIDLSVDIEPIEVPPLENFIGETDEHSNNKLIKYIVGDKDKNKNGQFENSGLLKVMHEKNDAKRYMHDGEKVWVNQNDLDTVNFGDIGTTLEDDDGNEMNIEEQVNFGDMDNSDAREIKNDSLGKYQPTKELIFIRKHWKDILTINQVERINMLLNSVESKDVNINSLFHPVTGKFITVSIGKIMYPKKENNYIQPSVSRMLSSIRRRMKKALKDEGFEDVELHSNFRKLENHSMKDNRKYIAYKIDEKYTIKEVYIESELGLYDDVKMYKGDQIIPPGDIEKLHRKDISVNELVNRYGLDIDEARNQNGAVYCFDADGNLIDKFKVLRGKYKYLDLKNVNHYINAI